MFESLSGLRQSEASTRRMHAGVALTAERPVANAPAKVNPPMAAVKKDKPVGTAVKFWLFFKAEFGQRIRIVGASELLGNWDHHKAPELEWSEGHMWHVSLTLPKGSVHEYKFVLCAADGVTPVAWQKGNNTVLAIVDEDCLDVFHEWSDATTHVVSADGHKCTSSERILLWTDAAIKTITELRKEVQDARRAQSSAEELARVSQDELRVTKSSLDEAKQLVRALQVLQQTKTEVHRRKEATPGPSAGSPRLSWGGNANAPVADASPTTSPPPPARSVSPRSSSASRYRFSRATNGASSPSSSERSQTYSSYDSRRSSYEPATSTGSSNGSRHAEDVAHWGRPESKSAAQRRDVERSSFQDPTPRVTETPNDDDSASRWGRPVKPFY